MSAITTHILDISKGRPAHGVAVVLEYLLDESVWNELGRGVTDADGRVKDLLSTGDVLRAGTYRLTFETREYFISQNIAGFYPQVTISFIIEDAKQHYHVPLLLSPFGYSTYRGS